MSLRQKGSLPVLFWGAISPVAVGSRMEFNMKWLYNPVLNIIKRYTAACAQFKEYPVKTLNARRYKSFRTISALVLREMGTTYGKSPGGYFWAVAEPIAAIAILSVAFQIVFRSPSLGTNFPLFFATGFLPFTLAVEMSNKVAKTIQFSKPLLFYPAVTVFDAVIARVLLSALTNVSISIIVLIGIHIIFDLDAFLRPGAIAFSLIMAVCMGFGLGVLNCYLSNALPLWERIWGIATRPLFLASCVIFLFDDLPSTARDILWYNPYVHVVGMMRVGFFPTYDAHYVSGVYVFGVGLTCAAIGLLLLKRHATELIHG
jgi:capsular polysaccharide transport system permease protein